MLIFSATEQCSTLPALFPSHVFRHYSYLSDALPDIVPHLTVSYQWCHWWCNVMSSYRWWGPRVAVDHVIHQGPVLRRSSYRKHLLGYRLLLAHVIWPLAHVMLSKWWRCVSGDPLDTVTMNIIMLFANSDLNQAALLDQTLGAPLHYLAMVCRCHVLLYEVIPLCVVERCIVGITRWRRRYHKILCWLPLVLRGVSWQPLYTAWKRYAKVAAIGSVLYNTCVHCNVIVMKTLLLVMLQCIVAVAAGDILVVPVTARLLGATSWHAVFGSTAEGSGSRYATAASHAAECWCDGQVRCGVHMGTIRPAIVCRSL